MSTQVVNYIDRVLVRRVDPDLLYCLTLHFVDYSDLKLVCARMALKSRFRTAGNWKFNASLLDRKNFRIQISAAGISEVVVGNR